MDPQPSDSNTFDSVQWTRDAPQSPSTAQPSHTTTTPLKSNGKRRQSSSNSRSHDDAIPDPNADDADLAGIGPAGYLDVTVGKPQKESEGSKDAFVSYLVSTESDFRTFTTPSFTVRRRYTDFAYLYRYLHRAYAYIAVPPLPEKASLSYVRGDRFGADFTQRRAAALNRFIRRISAHPVLRRNATFLVFLESPEWNATMKGRGAGAGGRGSMSEGSNAGGSVSGMGASGMGGVGGSTSAGAPSAFESFQDWSMNLFSRPHKPDKRFVEVRERCDKLDEDLSHVEKIAVRVARREGDLEADTLELATQVRKLVNLEPGVGAELGAFAGSVEESAALIKTLREEMERGYLGSLRDMSAYVGSLRQLLRTREQKQLDFEALTEYLSKSATERDSLASQSGSMSLTSAPAGFLRQKVEDMRGVDHESSRRHRLRQKEMEIERLTREVEESKKTSEAFDDQVVGECREFERIKAGEFKESMGGLCEAECAFWRGSIGTWEEFLKGLEKEGAVVS